MSHVSAPVRRPIAAVALAVMSLLAAAALAHPTHKPGDKDDHGHTHTGVKDGTSDVEPDSGGPSDAEKTLRVEQLRKRAEHRKARIVEIRKDRRKALRRRLASRLQGYALSKSMKAELRTHGRRMARLKRIRYVAATQNDYDSIQSVDKLIGKENSRHETWWRAIRREAVAKAVAAKTKPTPAKPKAAASGAKLKGKRP